MRVVASIALALVTGVASALSGGAKTQGDPRNGETVYSRCLACHALAYDRTGPRHCGLLGRRAGSVDGFASSPAMKRSAIVWNTVTLDRFLSNPLAMIPGTSMGYAADRCEGTRRPYRVSRSRNASVACRQ